MAFNDANDELYAYGSDVEGKAGEYSYAEEYGHLGVWAFPIPAPGPSIESGTERATPELRGAANFEATINPEGNPTTYRVEYVDEKSFDKAGFASATSTETLSLKESGFNDEHVEIHLPQKTLTPGVTYHWRLVAVDSLKRTSSGPGQSFEEIPAALIEGPWATNVASTSATLSAGIDPQGANTSYRVEYGTSTSYGYSFSGKVGEGMGFVAINYHIQELQPHTTYYYRLVTTSEVGTIEVEHTFTTQLASDELTLPDGRAWQLVSPPNKKAANIGPIYGVFSYSLTQAASDGNGIAYTVSEPLGEGATGHIFFSQVLSTRTADGWSTHDVSASGGLPPEGESAAALFEANERWHLFSSNLSIGLLEPGSSPTPQSPEATERTLYLRDNSNGEFQPLESQADVPSGLKFGDEEMQYFTATPDLSYVVFGTRLALTPEAVNEMNKGDLNPLNLYEWHDKQLQLVNILPDESTRPGATVGGIDLGAGGGEMTAHAISSDGRWVVWKYGDLRPGAEVALYARNMVAKRTVKVGGPFARFETMSSDGSKIFYVETERGVNGDLYVFDTETGVQTDLTANRGSGEHSAGVQNAIMGSSQDGSYIYFVATGVLAKGAVKGGDNLYLLHDGSNGWTTTYIATLSKEDEHTWGGTNEGEVGENPKVQPWLVSSEVSPNGRYVAFMSNSPLTGYDNRDAVSGQRDEEVFLYDADSNHLVCASCNPTGARPVGVFDQGGGEEREPLLVDRLGMWTELNGVGTDHWLAGSLVGWNNEYNVASYQPRYVMDSGRLFFNSPDALVPQDTNGLEDVYEYEPSSIGSCTREDATFSEVSQGCVGLISSGQSSEESTFMDASESGDDVFFVASNKLTSEDYDNAYDMYDAHVCTSAEPCQAEPVSPPECTSGDSCKAAPSSQPTIFGATPSATFKGVGNITPSTGGGVTPKALTRAQKLVQALKVCGKEKRKKKRAICERQAEKRYGAKQPRKTKATKKGNR